MRDSLGDVQSVLVLGGTSDIGVAIAARLAGPRQARVVLAGRHPETLEKAAAQVREAGAGQVATVPFDAVETDAHDQVLADAAALVGDLDVVVVAFGLLGDAAVDAAGGPGAVELARVNYVGAVSACLAAARRLRRQGHGVLVVLSSVAGERVRKANFIYGSSKAGIDGFAQGLGDSLVGSGVRVLVVRPGFVTTKMTAGLKAPPLSTTAAQVAAATDAALRRGSEVIWVPGALRWLMVALRHLPRPLFRRLPL